VGATHIGAEKSGVLLVFFKEQKAKLLFALFDFKLEKVSIYVSGLAFPWLGKANFAVEEARRQEADRKALQIWRLLCNLL